MKYKCKICGKKARLFIKAVFDDRYKAPGFFDIYRCPGCGFGFINSFIIPEKAGEFYGKYYPLSKVTPSQVRKQAAIKPAIFNWLFGTSNIAHLYIKPHSLVLDIGSASGVSLLEISKLKGKAYGVEPDPHAQKIAKKLNVHVFKGLITDNPFPDKKFDFITASQVIEHVPDAKVFLEAIGKKINHKGQVILSFPNVDSLYRRVFGRKWINWHVPYHRNFFTKKSFIILAHSTGYKILKIKTVTPNIWTILQLRRFFTRPRVGAKGEIWAVRDDQFKLAAMVLKVMVILAIIIVTPLNRIIDRLGQGDSIIVWLEQKKR